MMSCDMEDSQVSSDDLPEASPASSGFDVPGKAAEIRRGRRFLSWRRMGYAVGCLAISLGSSALSIGLWSDIGCKEECIGFLQRYSVHSRFFAAIVLVAALLLYMLDFFTPAQRLPGLEDRCLPCIVVVGRGLFGLALLAGLAWLYLWAHTHPTLPLVFTALFGPSCVLIFRRVTAPVVPECPASVFAVKGLEDRIALIKLMAWEEKDERNFYMSAACAFAASGFACLVAWVITAIEYEEEFNREMSLAGGRGESELLYARWAAPAYVALSNFIYASFACLRVTLSGAYTATDQIKSQLVCDFSRRDQRRMQYRTAMFRARVAAARDQQELVNTTQDLLQKYLVQHISATRKLSNVVKSVCLTLFALILASHIVFQMLSAVDHNAMMIQGFLASYLAMFIIFIFVSLNRVSRQMAVELTDLSFVRNIIMCSQRGWARALLLCVSLPVVPFVVAVSFAKQIVRKARGIATTDSLLTDRVDGVLRDMKDWDWLELLGWCYVMGGVLVVFSLTPIFLNVLLAWMSDVMAGFNYWLIVAVTVAMGTFLFMLPPVPGPVIYPFAGIVMSDPEKCPFGYLAGCAISVIVSILMKMLACALQQKGIGEQLGSRLRIRRAVGIHRPPIRAIESVLRQPGLSFGKCMILCGGPDWPTSVLAGILRLSVWQCLLGTCPIVLSIAPSVLTGSFLLKRGESEVWMRLGNFMLLLTMGVSAFFLVGMGWAIQDSYEKRGGEISRPKEEFVELEWLDHRASVAGMRCKVRWPDVPRVIRAVYVVGAVLLTFAVHMLLWFKPRCFGRFELTDDIRTLRWYGHPDALVKVGGVVGVGVAMASYLALGAFRVWRGRWTRGPLKMVLEELDAEELEWKEAWLEETRRANLVTERTRCSLSSASTLSVALPGQSCAGEQAAMTKE